MLVLQWVECLPLYRRHLQVSDSAALNLPWSCFCLSAKHFNVVHCRQIFDFAIFTLYLRFMKKCLCFHYVTAGPRRPKPKHVMPAVIVFLLYDVIVTSPGYQDNDESTSATNTLSPLRVLQDGSCQWEDTSVFKKQINTWEHLRPRIRSGANSGHVLSGSLYIVYAKSTRRSLSRDSGGRVCWSARNMLINLCIKYRSPVKRIVANYIVRERDRLTAGILLRS